VKIPKGIDPGIHPELSTNLPILLCRHEVRRTAHLADRIVPNRNPLTLKSRLRNAHLSERISLSSVLCNWAALVALWALPYLTLLDHLHPDAAHSEILEWSLLVIGALGLASLLYTAFRETLDPAWRARHGLAPRARPGRPHIQNIS